MHLDLYSTLYIYIYIYKLSGSFSDWYIIKENHILHDTINLVGIWYTEETTNISRS